MRMRGETTRKEFPPSVRNSIWNSKWTGPLYVRLLMTKQINPLCLSGWFHVNGKGIVGNTENVF